MTHLVFIHGINNQKHYPSDIREGWWDYLVEGWNKHGFGPLPAKPKITVGYYAQRLYAACKGQAYLQYDPNNELPPLDLATLVTMGETTFNTSGDGIGLLEEYAAANDFILPAEEVQTQGIIRRNLIKLGDWIEDKLPAEKSKNLARTFLGQAAIYCDDPGLRRGIERQVMQLISGVNDPIEPINSLGNEPIILVTHSLGTAVGYRMLFDPAAQNTEIPLLVTLGSPLSLKFIKKSLDQNNLTYPEPPVGRWVNAHHKEDVVTLGNSLAEENIGFPGIENYDAKEYGFLEGRHNIGPHLKTREVSEAIYQALTS